VTRNIPRAYAIPLDRTEGALDARRLVNVPQSDVLRGEFARRIGNALGSFVAKPLAPRTRATVAATTPSAGKIKIALPPITAYVEGVEVLRPTAEEVEVDQALDVATIEAEAHTYTAAANPFPLNKAASDPSFPVKQVTNLVADVQIGTVGTGGYESVTKGAPDGQDSLANPAIAIIRISDTQGGPADYTATTDYILTGGQVDWSPGGSEPTPAATYYVVYQYRKTMVESVDFVLDANDAIDFSVGGDDPVESSSFDVDYEYYLPRTDLIIVRPDGTIGVVKGIPAEEPLAPRVPLLAMEYVFVLIAANDATPTFKIAENDTVHMTRLNRMRRRITENQENAAILALTQQAHAIQGDEAKLLNSWGDQFENGRGADETYDVGGVTYDCLIDTGENPLRQELTLPTVTALLTPAKTAPPGGETDVRVGPNFWTLPFTHELAIDAPKYSAEWPVNPYQDFTPEPPVCRIEPAQDIWVDTTDLTNRETRIVQNGAHEDWSIVDLWTEVAIQVSEMPRKWMRAITVRLFGATFVPGEYIRFTFAGLDNIDLTAVAPTTQGPDSQTVVARASDATHVYGDWMADFTIPTKTVASGTVAVRVFGNDGVGATWPDDYTEKAVFEFTSEGTLRLVITTITTVLVQNDPVAQSLTFASGTTPAMRMISRVDVPLAAKAPNLAAPLILELRATDRAGEASSPTTETLARIVREPPDLNVGPASSNVFTFDEPLLALAGEFRSLVLRTSSPLYRVYVAKLAGPDLAAGGFIEEQQIPAGIFMDSSNNRDWTLRQGWDLRCKVYVAKFAPTTAYLYLARITTADLTSLFLNTDQVVPDGTAINWQYSRDGKALSDGTKTWYSFLPQTITEFTAATSTLDIRAILTTSDPYLTPGINHDTLSVFVASNKLSLTYVSIAKTLTAATTALDGVIVLRDGTSDASNSSVYVSADDGTNWTGPVGLTKTGNVGGGFASFRFAASGLTSGSMGRVRIEQSTSNRAIRPRCRSVRVHVP
jgi:hypothetical protein